MSHYRVETGHIQADVDDLNEFLVYAKDHCYQQPFAKLDSRTAIAFSNELPTQGHREVQLLSEV